MGLTDILFWTAVIPGFTDTLTTTMNHLAADLTLDLAGIVDVVRTQATDPTKSD
jgi:hypothetical protein